MSCEVFSPSGCWFPCAAELAQWPLPLPPTAGRPRCSSLDCARPIGPYAGGYRRCRPIQRWVLPTDLCAGHGEIWIVGQALAAGCAKVGDAEISDAMLYAQEAFAFCDALIALAHPHYLYRLWSDRELLYVGETNDITRRLREHSKDKAWWPEVRGHTHEPFFNESEAVAAEGHAIKTESPKYNIKGRVACPT